MADEREETGGYDLHVHSAYSDGSQSVRQIIAESRELGLERIGVVDHDCLRQLSDVRRTAWEEGFPVLAGAEVSCRDSATGRIIHMLAYGLEATPDGSGPVDRIVEETLARRTANTLWQAWTLVRAGVEFDGWGVCFNDLNRAARESTGLYKQHVMYALTALPYTDERYQACYRKLFKNGGIVQRDIEYPQAVDVVRAIREQGGVPVLAHPAQMDSWASIPSLLSAGLLGIEVYHPDNNAEAQDRARKIAREHGLIMTGGSDYHGYFGKPDLGECTIDAVEAGEGVEQLFRREAELIARAVISATTSAPANIA